MERWKKIREKEDGNREDNRTKGESIDQSQQSDGSKSALNDNSDCSKEIEAGKRRCESDCIQRDKITEHINTGKCAGKRNDRKRSIDSKVNEQENEKTVGKKNDKDENTDSKISEQLKTAGLENRKQLTIQDLGKNFKNIMNNELKEREPCRVEECRIRTQDNRRICILGQRRISQALLKGTRKEIKKLISCGIIENRILNGEIQ